MDSFGKKAFPFVVGSIKRYRSKHRECSHTPENAALLRLAFLLVGIVPNPYESNGKEGE
jgi:hypothetical protein